MGFMRRRGMAMVKDSVLKTSLSKVLIVTVLFTAPAIFAQKNSKPVTFKITEDELVRKGKSVTAKPERYVKRAEYFDYIFSADDFNTAYGSDISSRIQVSCLPLSEKSDSFDPNAGNKKGAYAVPQGGFQNTTIRCAIPKEEFFAYHREVFDELPGPNKHGLTIFLSKNGWKAMAKDGKVAFDVVQYDNGPDYISQGLFRFIKNGKMGFADEKGKICIPAKYDFVSPFDENGKASFCNGCKKVYSGEHFTMKGGKTGTITTRCQPPSK